MNDPSDSQHPYHTRRAAKQQSGDKDSRSKYRYDDYKFMQQEEDVPDTSEDAEKHKRLADDEKIKAFVGFKIERDDINLDESNHYYQGLRKTFKKYIDRKLTGLRQFFDSEAIKSQISEAFVQEMENEEPGQEPLWKQYKYLANEGVYKILKREKRKLSEMPKRDVQQMIEKAKQKSSVYPKKKARAVVPSSHELTGNYEPRISKRGYSTSEFVEHPQSFPITQYEKRSVGRPRLDKSYQYPYPPFALGRLQGKIPDMQRSLCKTLVNQLRLQKHMIVQLKRNDQKVKLGRDSIQAMQSVVDSYFSNLLKDLYSISRKRHVGQEMRGKLHSDVGYNTVIMNAFSTKMGVIGGKNKAIEELNKQKQVEIRFGNQPQFSLKMLQNLRSLQVREQGDLKRQKKQKGPKQKVTSLQEFEIQQKVNQQISQGKDELETKALREANIEDVVLREIDDIENEEKKSAYLRKSKKNVRAEMDIKVFPQSDELKHSQSRQYVTRIVGVEELRVWLRKSPHFFNNKLHNYIEMNEQFCLKR